MSSTLASLGLPEPEPAKPDTLASLGLPEPVRPQGGRSRGKGGGATWPDPFSPEEIHRRDPAGLPDEGLGPLSLIPLFRAGGAGYKAGEAVTKGVGSWLARKAAAGAASGAAGGAVEAASREANPAGYVAGGAAGGALLGPAVEAAIPAVGRLLTGLRGKATASGKATVSPVEPTSAPPLAKEPIAPGPAPVAQPVVGTQGGPLRFEFIRRTTKTPNMGSRFGQDVEPAGRYMNERPGGGWKPEEHPELQTGVVEFKNPLRIDEGGGYGTPTNWKNVLSERYGGKVGKELSKAIVADGYDGILTKGKYGMGEVVDLTSFVKTTTAAVPVPPVGKTIPAPGPVTGANAQQFPMDDAVVARIKSDPEYLAHIQELSGHRVQTNAETLARAWDEGPMPVEQIAAWTAETPLNTVQQTRALITFDYFNRKSARALFETGDLREWADAEAVLTKILPGTENIRATGGRMTQAQSMFVRSEMDKIRESLADMQEKGVPLEQVRAKANEMLRQAATAARGKRLSAELREALGGIETAATFAKLTSPVTHAVNTISNALTFGIVRPLEKAGTALAYLGQGNVPAARAEVSTLFGTRMGFRAGFERYVRTLMDDATDPGKMIEVNKGRNIPLPRALRPFDVFRQLAAADGFWKGVLSDARLHELAHRSAAGEGLKGPALAARIKALVDDPPAAWRAEVEQYAKEFTFQSDPDRFLSAVQKVQALPFVRLFIPFVQTPYNLARFQFQRSGVGLLSPRNVKGLAAGGQAQAEAIGRLTAGAGLSAGALALVSTTQATGDYPSDPRERERWKAENIKPYSLRLPNGTWIAYNRFAPVGIYIGQAVALREAMERGDEQGIAGAASTLAASSLKQINDMPFLSGLSDLLDAVKEPDRSAERFGQGVVTGLIPNIARDVRQQTDPTLREARGVPQAVTNMLPGLSQKLPASIDVLGRERTYEPDRLLRATKVLSTQRSTPETQLFAKLEWSPNAPSLRLEKGKADTTLTGRDAEHFKREMGAATRKGIATARAMHPNLDKLEREEQIEILDREINRARKPVRKKFTLNLLKGR